MTYLLNSFFKGNGKNWKRESQIIIKLESAYLQIVTFMWQFDEDSNMRAFEIELFDAKGNLINKSRLIFSDTIIGDF